MVRPFRVKDQILHRPPKIAKPGTLKLYLFDEVPAFLQRRFILSGYRYNIGFKACLHSIFSIHNETGNIWTHLFAVAYFLYLTISIPTQGAVSEGTLEDKAAFFLSCFAFAMAFFASVANHTFNCHSERVHFTCSQLDFQILAISMILPSYPIMRYGFTCAAMWRQSYVLASAGMLVLAICMCRLELKARRNFPMRRAITLMFVLYMSPIAVVHQSYHMHSSEELSSIRSALMFGFAAPTIGAFVYLSRCPERLKPGWFDIWFHSHQWWHVWAALGAYVHINTCVRLYEYIHSLPLDVLCNPDS
eukprot:TRINITY_DN15383_c0_g1::TRINITY_DN15383_c0_g1_i1::g.22729::m.22729 TRINITY_DN15383_c0_g1::TRINITY_DN15383_c0_g1_i1::g.22729  ORF type:complete len:304 (-),score=41.27,sp/Q86V24/ADR2_HUMAN/31.50/7e-26,HlyIII/PF03006.15/1.1e-37,Tom5/PF10642.4/2.4e+03,Tom5/PF10642.4/0.68,YrhC/PF14143.1/0.37,YrhC/PF14143.1/2.1e+03 TRINITY_DN15383_c0_g1_i1:25-936(-)